MRRGVDPPGVRPIPRGRGADHPGPVHGREAQQDRARRKLLTGLGREPTTGEVTEVTGIEPGASTRSSRSARRRSLDPSGRGPVRFGQLIADDQPRSPYERAAKSRNDCAAARRPLCPRRVLELHATDSATSTRAHSTRSAGHSTSPASETRRRTPLAQEAPATPLNCACWPTGADLVDAVSAAQRRVQPGAAATGSRRHRSSASREAPGRESRTRARRVCRHYDDPVDRSRSRSPRRGSQRIDHDSTGSVRTRATWSETR